MKNYILGENIYIMYLIPDLYPEYVKNSYNSIKINPMKNGQKFEQILHQGRYMNS